MFTTLYARTVAWLDMVFAVVAGHVRARNASFATGTVAQRGVTFIEYALLAAIAVVIAAIFRKKLGELFTSLLANIQKATDDYSTNNG